MITPAWALRCALAGMGASLVFMIGLIARTAVVVTVGHRWKHFRDL